MIVFPNCKINLGLNILGKRADTYHNLETVFLPLPLYDVLEVIQSPGTGQDYELFVSGLQIESRAKDNLCIKAYLLLKKDYPQLSPVKFFLHKAIPAGAGLGGGSADGAFMLMLLNDKFNLQLTQQQLLGYALSLGSDCPFFIINKPCFARQRGELLEPLQLDLRGYKLVLINPGIHINTGWAFTQVNYSTGGKIKEIIRQPLKVWKEQLTNDFELPVFEKYPEIEAIKNHLYTSGALYASMSGTGSTVFGIFNKDTVIEHQEYPGQYFIKEMVL